MRKRFPISLCFVLIACPSTPAPNRPADAGTTDAITEVFGESATRVRTLALFAVTGTTTTDKAISKAQAEARLLPRKVDPWLVLGSAWIRKARESGDPGFYTHANACAEAVEHVEPGNISARALRGAALLSDHKFAEAKAEAERILASDPGNAVALGMVSDALLELGDYDGAVKAADAMSGVKPDIRSYVRIAHLRWLRGDSAGAKEAYRAAIEAGRLNSPAESVAWALVEAANVFWNEGDYFGSEKGYDMALETLHDYGPALMGKARAALAQGRQGQAAFLARSALERKPSAEAAALLYDALEAQGDAPGRDAALAEVERLGRADSRTLALFLASTKIDVDRALKLAKSEYDARPSDVSKDVYAFALLRAGRADEARPLADAAIARGTPDPRWIFHAGAARLAAGDKSGRKLIQRALELCPSFHPREAAEAKSLLASK